MRGAPVMFSGDLQDAIWLTMSSIVVLLMQPGLCLLESGRVRAKNGIHIAAKSLSDLCVSGAVFWMVGFGLMFGASHAGWIGTSHFLCNATEGAWTVAFVFFQMALCGVTAAILSGAIAERARFTTYLAVAAWSSALVYPAFGHWVWGGTFEGGTPGWLAALGFRDFAGATVVHSVGGWIALAAVLRVGPRIGRFAGGDGHPIRGDNLCLSGVGVLLVWLGWLGLHCGSVLRVGGAIPEVALNTFLGACFGGLGAMLISMVYRGRIHVPLLMNGILAGLVSVSGAAAWLAPGDAAAAGFVGSGALVAGKRALERMGVDDAVDAVPVHAFCGVWGAAVVALLARPEDLASGLGRMEQLGIQLLGSAVAFAWSFGTTWVLLGLLDTWKPLRVTEEAERVGLNVAEHGASSTLQQLLGELTEQRQSGDFSRSVHVEPETEVGEIAAEYNRVRARMNAQTEALARAAEESNALYEELAAARDAAVDARREIQNRLEEISSFNELMVDRELRMIELKRMINDLSERLGERAPFAKEHLGDAKRGPL